MLIVQILESMDKEPSIAAKSAFLVLRHIRSINHIKETVRSKGNSLEYICYGHRTRMLQLRQQLLRYACSEYAAGYNHDEITDLANLQDSAYDDYLVVGYLRYLTKNYLLHTAPNNIDSPLDFVRHISIINKHRKSRGFGLEHDKDKWLHEV